jgi:hypothetical protein
MLQNAFVICIVSRGSQNINVRLTLKTESRCVFMKRKIFLFMAVVILVAGLSGCTAKKNKTVELGSTTDDSQPYWNIFDHNVARGENGYYYVLSSYNVSHEKATSGGTFLYYMDEAAGGRTPLCAKPDCNHKNAQCNAFLSAGYGYNQVYYYKGYLYVYKYHADDGLVYLVRISADGSERKELFEIGTGESTAECRPYCLVFHDDSVYIYIREGGISGYDEITTTLRRRSLDGKEDENVYERTSVGAQVYGVKAYGNKIFFMVEDQSRTSEHSQERVFTRHGLFVYDCDTKTYEQLIDGAVCDYTIDTDNNVIYYYVVNDGLYKRSLSDEGKAEKLYKFEDKQTNICQLSYDGTYLYMNNELYPTFYLEKVNSFEIYVCDRDGNILKQIESSGTFSTFFGDSEYLFSFNKDAGRIRYIKKSEILTDVEWTTLW